jgi:hypothetical protein
MTILNIMTIWVLLALPIMFRVNKRMEELDDDARFDPIFQIIVIIKSFIYVPIYYLVSIKNILK